MITESQPGVYTRINGPVYMVNIHSAGNYSNIYDCLLFSVQYVINTVGVFIIINVRREKGHKSVIPSQGP